MIQSLLNRIGKKEKKLQNYNSKEHITRETEHVASLYTILKNNCTQGLGCFFLYFTINPSDPLKKHRFSSWPITLPLQHLKVRTYLNCGLVQKISRNHSRLVILFLIRAKASLYTATTFAKTARTIINTDRILSFLVAMLYRSLQ